MTTFPREQLKAHNFRTSKASKLENLIGQMIVAGFRGDTANEQSDIVKYIKKYNLAGVILYDEDVEIGGTG